MAKTTSSAASTSAGAHPWSPEQKGAPTLQSVARILHPDHKPHPARKVVVLAGAGISTASGIPDFRSPETGLYANLKKYSLPYPEAIFDIDYFREKPEAFFALSKELYPGNFKPTLTHCFFKLLHDKGQLLRVFTQNIDTLERLAGLPADKIVEAHGSFAASRCIRCKHEVDPDWMRAKCMAGEVAHCEQPACKRKAGNGGGQGGLVKPDIVFFGEGLPDRFFARLGDLKVADLLIVVGTSLQVHPFAGLVHHVRDTCPRVLVNLERVGEIAGYSGGGGVGGMRSLFMNETGFDFDGSTLSKGKGKEHIRDVFWQGKCDDGSVQLAESLGWKDELLTKHKDLCAAIDAAQLHKDAPDAAPAEKADDESLVQAEKTAKTTASQVAHNAGAQGPETKADDTDSSAAITQRLQQLNVSETKSSKDDEAASFSKKGPSL